MLVRPLPNGKKWWRADIAATVSRNWLRRHRLSLCLASPLNRRFGKFLDYSANECGEEPRSEQDSRHVDCPVVARIDDRVGFTQKSSNDG